MTLPGRRTLGAAGLAFAVGFLVGALARGGGGTPLAAEPDHAAPAILLVVENVGPRPVESAFRVVDLEEGRVRGRASLDTAPGGRALQRLQGPFAGQHAVEASFSWSEVGRSGRGSVIETFEGDDCSPGQIIVLTFQVDTTNGIALPRGVVSSCGA